MSKNPFNVHIFKSSPFAGLIVLTDSPRFTIVDATNNFLTEYQIKEADVLKKGFFEIFGNANIGEPNNNLSQLVTLFSTIVQNSTPAKVERLFLKPQNDDKYLFEAKCVDIEIIPVLNETDLPASIIVSIKHHENRTVSHNLDGKNSAYYSSIVENSLNAFFLTKPDGTILEGNKAACDLFGYSLDELRQIGREGIIDHSDALALEKIRERNEKGKVKAELVGIKKNGEKFPVEVSSVKFLDVNGEERTSTFIIDITDRKNAENALQKSEYLLHEAQKLAKMGSWNFDFAADKLTWTEGLYDVFGANKETFHETHGSFINLVTEEDRAFVVETSKQSQLTGEPFNIEYRIITPNGENRIIEEFGYSEKNATGDIVRLFGTAQDITERRQVEQVLKTSERKYKTLFEDNPLPMFIWDFETLNIIDCNEEALIKYGYTRPEFLQLSIRDIRPKEDIDLIKNATANETVYGKIHKEVWRHLKKNGELMLMEVNAHLMDYNGRRAALVLLNDVTEKLETEKAVLLSNERFTYLNLVTDDVIYDWDIVNDSFAWGESFNRIFNYQSQIENFSFNSWIKLMHPDDVEPGEKPWQLFLADKNKFKWEHEFRFKRGDNSYALVEEIGYLIRDENGNPKRMIGVLRDQTQHKKQEQHLKLLESVITNTNDAVLITEAEPLDEPGPKIIYVNEAFLKMTGYNADEVIGKTPRILQGPKSDKTALARLSKALRNWESCEITTVNYKKNGDEFWVNFTPTPIADEKGRFTHWISIQRDVTQSKNEEQQKLLLVEISRIFNQPKSFAQTLNQVLQAIVASGNLCMAEAWMIDNDKKKLNLLAKHTVGDKTALLYSENIDFTNVAIGEGLPGIVGQTQTIHQWNVDVNEDYFIRKKEAIKAGIKKIIGIPLFYNETVIGSILLGSNSSEKIQNEFIFQSQDFSVHLGAEIKRKQLEQELNQVFDYSNDIICIADFNGYFKKINPVASELLGYTQEELLNKPFSEFVHPDDQNLTLKVFDTHGSGANVDYFENRYITKSGQTIWLAWTATSSLEDRLVFAVAKDVTDKKKLQDLLDKANRLARIGSWEIDFEKEGNYLVYWSPITKDMLEVNDDYRPSINGILELYQGESKQIKQSALEQLIATGKEFDLELLVITAKGKAMWIRCTGHSERLDGKCIKIFGSFQDIDEQKKAAIKLAESENRFRTILEAEPECIKLLGPAGELLMMNPAGLAMIEVDSVEQVANKSILKIILPEHRSAFSNLSKKVFKGESGKLVFEIEGLKGTRRWLETHAVPLKNELGEIISLLGVTRDITETKKAEESIRQSNERFEKVTEATNDAIWDWDIVNDNLYRGNGFNTLFGYELNKSMHAVDFWQDNFHSDDLNLIKESLQKVIEDRNATHWQQEYRIIKNTGDIATVIDRGIIIRNNTGKAIRMVGAMTDITYRKEYENSLKQLNETLAQNAQQLSFTNKELEQFAYVASHDLQEPLRMVTSFLIQLEKKYGDRLDDNGKKYIYFAVDGAKRMRQIILDLLEFSRVGRVKDDIEKVNCNELVSDVLLLLTNQIEESHASITVENLPLISTYKTPLRQVFQNLIGNALKYRQSEKAPVITISCKEIPEYWMFSIKDNGIGINKEYFEKIFIIFQRLHNKDEYTGTGIGLAIVKKIINNLDGKIWLESEEGTGTVFYFTLPK